MAPVHSWILIPAFTTVILTFLLSYFGYIECHSYADTLLVTWTAANELFPGIVHCFHKDTGLLSVAKMDQKIWNKYKNAIVLLNPVAGRYQIGISLLKLYFVYFEQDMVFHMVIYHILFVAFRIIFDMVNINREDRRKAANKMIPNAPARKRKIISIGVIALYFMAKCFMGEAMIENYRYYRIITN